MRNKRSIFAATLITLLLVFSYSATSFAQQTGKAKSSPLEIHVKHTEPRTVAVIRHKGPFEEISSVTKDLIAQIDKGGHLMAGPVIIRYLDDPKSVSKNKLRWEVMIPVVKPGRLGGTEFDKLLFKYMDVMNVAFAYHIGPVETISETYGEMFNWVGKSGYDVVGPPMEVYWSNPETTPPEKFVVELWVPISEERKPRVVR